MSEPEIELPPLPPKWAAEDIACAFHEAYEELAPEHGYETRRDSAVPWADVPKRNQRLMVATVAQLLKRGIIRPGDTE